MVSLRSVRVASVGGDVVIYGVPVCGDLVDLAEKRVDVDLVL